MRTYKWRAKESLVEKIDAVLDEGMDRSKDMRLAGGEDYDQYHKSDRYPHRDPGD